MPTKIQWADETINPFKEKIDGEVKGYHCTKVSEGCAHCYAEAMNLNDGFYPWANGLPYDDRKCEYVLDEKVLAKLLSWRRPRRVFVQSMSDPFHEDIPDELIVQLLHYLAHHDRHVYMLLTKRPGRMKEVWAKAFPDGGPRHIWLGVTAENQARADERIPTLLETPAAVHFVSIEPMLGPVNLMNLKTQRVDYDALGGCGVITSGIAGQTIPNCYGPKLDWVIVGGETGPGARFADPDWVRDVRDQCQAAGVPFFFKQWSGKRKSGRLLDGREWNEYPKHNGE